jgi:hypothetical protein
VEVEAAGPSVGMFICELAGFGRRLLLVAPSDVDTHLLQSADELRGLYGRPGG